MRNISCSEILGIAGETALFSFMGTPISRTFDRVSGPVFGLSSAVLGRFIKPLTSEAIKSEEKSKCSGCITVAMLVTEYVIEVSFATVLTNMVGRPVKLGDAAAVNLLPFLIRTFIRNHSLHHEMKIDNKKDYGTFANETITLNGRTISVTINPTDSGIDEDEVTASSSRSPKTTLTGRDFESPTLSSPDEDEEDGVYAIPTLSALNATKGAADYTNLALTDS